MRTYNKCFHGEIRQISIRMLLLSGELVSVAHLDAHLTCDQEVVVQPPLGRQHSFVGIDHEIFSPIILPRLLIQEG